VTIGDKMRGRSFRVFGDFSELRRKR